METIQAFFSYLTHIDVHLLAFVATYGSLTYIALFLVIFCETGLIVTPFLPGDSLLFAAGSLAANASPTLDIRLLFVSLLIASIIGNKVNYLVGRYFGTKVTRFINPKHLAETNAYYKKHGGKTVIFARFIPIVRTIAPFVAGVGEMDFKQFAAYNIGSAFLWVGSLLAAGYYFGAIPIVKAHFTLVIYGIIVVSFMPPVITLIYRKAQSMMRRQPA